MKVIVIEDALAGNAPYIRDLEGLNLRYILGVKPGGYSSFNVVKSISCMVHWSTKSVVSIQIIVKQVISSGLPTGLVPLDKSNPDVLFYVILEINNPAASGRGIMALSKKLGKPVLYDLSAPRGGVLTQATQ